MQPGMDAITPLFLAQAVQTVNVNTSLLIAGGLWVAWKIYTIGGRQKGLPPGPPTVPVLGNIHKFPAEHIALKLVFFISSLS